MHSTQLYIDGDWKSARSNETFESFNPATGEAIGLSARASRDDIDDAVSAARRSFNARTWTGLKPAERQRILWRIGEKIDEQAPAIAALETQNNGMPLDKAEALVRFGAEFFRYNAGWCTKVTGQTSQVSTPGQYHAYTRREPLGVAALITPWNVPFTFACAKLSVALAAGCSTVFKPAEETPLSALLLADMMTAAGVPAGVVNIVTGFGDVAGAALAEHPDVDKLGFTGSTEVGRKIIRAAAGNLKKLSLELGGKSPVVIFEDADIQAAAVGAAIGVFNNSGQACVAGSRVYVARSRYDEVVEAMAAQAQRMPVLEGTNPSSQLGPLISQRQLDRVLGLLASGLEDGAELVTGGKRVGDRGYFIEPTVLTAPKPGARILREEIFGPVVNVIPFDDEEEVIGLANATEYGLAAGIWTRDIGRAHRVAERIKAGTVWLNTALAFDVNMPFGGYKQSGWGREYGAEGLDAFLQTKSVFTAL